MKLNEFTKAELETMAYDEIAYMILEESGKKLKLNDLFQRVCKALDYNEEEFLNHITDFFELLSTNKKFIMLDNGYWDIQSKHKVKFVIEDNEEDEIIETEEESIDDLEEEKEEKEENLFYEGDDTDDVDDDGLEDLVVVSDDEEASL